jgi:hypothetical protein
MGEPKHAERYCGSLAPSITCLTDETTHPYTVYGLRDGSWGELVSPSVIKAGIRAYKSGSRQGEAMGDTKMLPGTFIVDRTGIIRYVYYSTHPGDHPAVEDLVKTAQAFK